MFRNALKRIKNITCGLKLEMLVEEFKLKLDELNLKSAPVPEVVTAYEEFTGLDAKEGHAPEFLDIFSEYISEVQEGNRDELLYAMAAKLDINPEELFNQRRESAKQKMEQMLTEPQSDEEFIAMLRSMGITVITA